MSENSTTSTRKPPGKRGRPSKFAPAMLKQAQFLSEKGCTDIEMASFFEVSEKTLNTWKKEHPDFLDALKAGKSIADDRVQNALFQRAVGFSHPDTHVSNHQGTITLTPIVKHLPPETVAAIFWLKNRRPAEWRDKIDVNANQTGTIEIVIGGDSV